MREFRLSVSNVEVSFRAKANPEDVERARALLEEQSERLKGDGGIQSKEKMLALLALGVAYDLLQLQHKLNAVEDRMEALLKRIDASA